MIKRRNGSACARQNEGGRDGRQEENKGSHFGADEGHERRVAERRVRDQERGVLGMWDRRKGKVGGKDRLSQ